jgi:hypothetical protein
MGRALQRWDAADRRQFVTLFERFSHDLAAISSAAAPQPTTKGPVHVAH